LLWKIYLSKKLGLVRVAIGNIIIDDLYSVEANNWEQTRCRYTTLAHSFSLPLTSNFKAINNELFTRIANRSTSSSCSRSCSGWFWATRIQTPFKSNKLWIRKRAKIKIGYTK